MTEPVDTHFVLYRNNWRKCGEAFCRLPGQVRLQSYPTIEAAESERTTREAAARAVVNPFAGAIAIPEDVSHLPIHGFIDYLKDHEIEPPTTEPPPPPRTGWLSKLPTWASRPPAAPPAEVSRRAVDWAEWWVKNQVTWTPTQTAAVWQAVDKVRFYHVQAAPKRNVAYAVIEIDWDYNDEYNYPCSEGGTVQTVYRSRANAEAACRRRNTEIRLQYDATLAAYQTPQAAGFERFPFDMEERLFPGQDPFGPPVTPPDDRADDGGLFGTDEVPFCEVVEIELEGTA